MLKESIKLNKKTKTKTKTKMMESFYGARYFMTFLIIYSRDYNLRKRFTLLIKKNWKITFI